MCLTLRQKNTSCYFAEDKSSDKGHSLTLIPYKEFPEDGVKVFQALLHSHLLGTSIVVRHIRDGVELPVIVQGKYAGTVPAELLFQ